MLRAVTSLRLNADVVWTVVARLVTLVCGVASGILTARMLGPAGRGEYFVAVVLAATIVQFGNLGLQSSNVYLLARDRSRLRGLLANSLWVSLAMGCTVAIAAALWASVTTRGLGLPPTELWLAVLLAPTSLFVLLGGSLLISLERMALYNALQVLGNVLQISLLGAAALTGGSVVFCLLASIASSAVVATAILITLGRLSPGSLCFEWQLFRGSMHYAGKAYVVCLLGYLMMRLNVFLLEPLSGPLQAGYYSIAAQAADVLWIFPTSVSLVLFPKLAGTSDLSWSHARGQLLLVAAVMAPSCLIAGLCMKWAVLLALGSAYLPAVEVLWWMLPGVFCYALSGVISQYHAARGMPRVLIVQWAAAVTLLAALGVWLIPMLGGVGAAMALSAASGLILILQLALALQAPSVQPTATQSTAAERISGPTFLRRWKRRGPGTLARH